MSERQPKESFADWCVHNNSPLMGEWDGAKNEMDPYTLGKNSSLKVWWKGPCGHEWQARVIDRTRKNSGCPICYGHYLIKGANDLQTLNPKLASEWNFEKNSPLKPSDVLVNSSKRVWWKGSCGHEWQAVVSKRNNGSGCPQCSGKALLIGSNDLKTVDPALASEWHPTKNGKMSPDMITSGSNKVVWWLGNCGHEWQASINNRHRGATCPYCAHKKLLPGFNDLSTLRPELAAEWNYGKNGDLKPDEVSPGSQKKVWWICPRGHEWQAIIYTRRDGNGCPVCSSEERTSFNEKAIVYYLRKKTTVLESYHCDFLGKKEIDIFLPEYNIGIEYDGDYFHNSIERDLEKKRLCLNNGIRLINIREPDCPFLNDNDSLTMEGKNEKALSRVISQLLNILPDPVFKEITVDVSDDRTAIYELQIKSNKDNSLSDACPDLSKEWHPVKNGSMIPSMFYKNSGRTVWWMCSKGHEWQAKINDRVNGKGCPYCSNKKVLIGYNDFKTTDPLLASEWDDEKNGNKTPEMFVNGSMESVWWRGKCGHSWKTTIAHRHAGEGCPVCAGKAVEVGFNDLASRMPELVSEWDYEKNKPLTPHDVTVKSGKEVWWICKNGHEWKTRVSQRTRGFGCPYCSGKYVIVGVNDLQTINPKLASEWHPTKNGNLTPSTIKAGSERKVWWICMNGHEWEATVKNRNRGTGCPICDKNRRSGRSD